MSEYQREADDGTPVSEGNVVAFVQRAPVRHAQPFLTDEERILLREMIAFYREARPKFEAVMAGCPMARRLLNIPEPPDAPKA